MLTYMLLLLRMRLSMQNVSKYSVSVITAGLFFGFIVELVVGFIVELVIGLFFGFIVELVIGLFFGFIVELTFVVN